MVGTPPVHQPLCFSRGSDRLTCGRTSGQESPAKGPPTTGALRRAASFDLLHSLQVAVQGGEIRGGDWFEVWLFENGNARCQDEWMKNWRLRVMNHEAIGYGFGPWYSGGYGKRCQTTGFSTAVFP